MKILAFDTTLGGCSAAVAISGDGPAEIHAVFELRDQEHAEAIVPMIERVLADARVGWPDLDAIAVTVGPGSFTGVRVGVATARGLALALDRPLIAATSLEVMAQQIVAEKGFTADCYAVAVDARRGEVYFALYDGSGQALSDVAALTANAALSFAVKKGARLVAGSGAPLLANAVGKGQCGPEIALPDLQPDARALAEIALGRKPASGPVRPLYLRPPDAKPQSGKAVPRRGQPV